MRPEAVTYRSEEGLEIFGSIEGVSDHDAKVFYRFVALFGKRGATAHASAACVVTDDPGRIEDRRDQLGGIRPHVDGPKVPYGRLS